MLKVSMWILTVVVCLQLSTLAHGLFSKCPSDAAIAPCSCTSPCLLCSPELYCENIRNPDMLEQVMNNSRGYKYQSLRVVNSRLVFIPTSVLESQKKLQLISLENSTLLFSLFDGAPASRSVSELRLSRVRMIRRFSWESLANLRNLKKVAFSDVVLRKLDRSFQRVPKSLQTLELVRTSTSELEEGVFSNHTGLELLTIHDSEIKELSKAMFPTPSRIVELNVSRNSIETFPTDFLPNLQSLRILDVSENKIKSLPQDVYESMSARYSAVSVTKNPISCDCSLRWNYEEKYPIFVGTCQDPQHLRGKEIRKLNLKDFEHC